MNSVQNNQPANQAGFSLLTKQKFPLSFIKEGDLETRLANYYEDGSAIGGLVFPALSEANRNRLVEAAKCPTQQTERSEVHFSKFQAEQKRLNQAANDRGAAWAWIEEQKRATTPENELEAVLKALDASKRAELSQVTEDRNETRGDQGTDGRAWTVISNRAWSGEFRIRTQVDLPAALPPEQAGTRVTNNLSESGARKIADSCQFMHIVNGGYRTFLTLTMDTAGRRRVEDTKAESWFCEVDTTKRRRDEDKNDAGALAVGFIKPSGGKLTGEWETAGAWVNYKNDNASECVKSRDDTDNWHGDASYCPVDTFYDHKKDKFVYCCDVTGTNGDDVTYSTIQKEVSRFFDAANKMRQRGWKGQKSYPWGQVKCFAREDSRTYENGKKKHTITCHGQGVQLEAKPSQVVSVDGYLADKKIKYKRKGVSYTWVVENPLNEDGQRNPHIHILMDWRVKYSHFGCWAQRLESLWGQGFAHIEKIKDSESAGAYMAKAAGYLSKAQGEDDQGPVRGNRYGISKCARAPEWCCLGKYPMHVMGHLITDVHDYFTSSYGHVFAGRKNLNANNDSLRQQLKAASTKDEKKGILAVRQAVGGALQKVRNQLNELPAIASKYQLIIKSEAAFVEFMTWAKSEYTMKESSWLPAKDGADQWRPWEERPEAGWKHEFDLRLHARKAARRWRGLAISLYEKWINEEPESDVSNILTGWEEFQEQRWAA